MGNGLETGWEEGGDVPLLCASRACRICLSYIVSRRYCQERIG